MSKLWLKMLSQSTLSEAKKDTSGSSISPFTINTIKKRYGIGVACLVLAVAYGLVYEKTVTMSCKPKSSDTFSAVVRLQESLFKDTKISVFDNAGWKGWCSGKDHLLLWNGETAICDWIPSKREICTPVKSETGRAPENPFDGLFDRKTCVVRAKPTNFGLDFHAKKLIHSEPSGTIVIPCDEFKEK